jgi:exopolyphosphatase/guanosine-5'-triphosphate,3'-diphosphate pyrophosphatase
MFFREAKPLAVAETRLDADEGARRAVIDIGSNTVRLVIFGGPARVPVMFYNEKITAKLGRGVAEDGRLSGKAMRAALASLARFAALLRLRGVTDVECVATAAVRDAANGPEFLAKVAALGLSPRLLSGEQEALIGAQGVLAAFPGAVGVVGDLGGGSLELTDVVEDRCQHGVSMPLGTLRLPQLRHGGAEKFTGRVREMLRAAQWTGAHGQNLYLVGGSWRALARYAMEREAWPIDDPHGFELLPDAALKLARSLMAVQSRDELASKAAVKPDIDAPAVRALSSLHNVTGISASRLASLPDAAALLGVLVRELKPARLIFSSWGLREGLLASRFSREVRAQEPLVVAVSDFVAGVGPALPEIAALVAAWTAPAMPGDASPDEPLRLAATMLALASMRAEPNLRAKQAADWALRKRWIGVTAEGRAMLAMAVRANNGRIAGAEDLLRLAGGPRLRQAQVWGLATRLCRRFTGGATRALAGSGLAVEDGQLVLWTRGDTSVLYTDTVARDHRWLAENLGLGAKFRAE